MMRLRILILIICLAPLTPAYAYLDPGTGSIILQLLFGGVAGAVAIAHLYWSRVKQAWHRIRGIAPDDDGDIRNVEDGDNSNVQTPP